MKGKKLLKEMNEIRMMTQRLQYQYRNYEIKKKNKKRKRKTERKKERKKEKKKENQREKES